MLLVSGGSLLAVMLSIVEASAQANSDSLIRFYTAKMEKYLDKDKKALDVFVFTKDGLEMYAPATDTSRKKLEYVIPWNWLGIVKENISGWNYVNAKSILREGDEKMFLLATQGVEKGKSEANTPERGLKPFSNFRIVLDPGHLAGDLYTAKMERKWVEMKTPPCQLIEGELTLATALILKTKLEEQGATVMVTRDKPNISAFGIDFKKWKDSLFLSALSAAYDRGDVSFEEKNYLLVKANETEIFRRFFAFEDVRERARRINEFQSDFSLIIHYNVDETNAKWNKPTRKNYNMAFVGGSFTADELDKPEARIDFLRLLLTDELERSIDFSKYIVEGLVKGTGVPSALDSCALYLKGNCLSTEVNGVFCRNLTLTRTVKGVVCYGESLYQDNINECKALSKKDFKIGDVETSKRVEEVAEAYYQGILNYVKSKRKP